MSRRIETLIKISFVDSAIHGIITVDAIVLDLQWIEAGRDRVCREAVRSPGSLVTLPTPEAGLSGKEAS